VPSEELREKAARGYRLKEADVAIRELLEEREKAKPTD